MTRTQRTALVWASLTILATAAAPPASAQSLDNQADTLLGRDRWRLTMKDGEQFVGRLIRWTPATLRLLSDPPHREFDVDRTQVAQFERSEGRFRDFPKYAGRTLLITTALGGILAAATWSECDERGSGTTDFVISSCLFHPDSRSEATGDGLLIGALAGSALGVVVGLLWKEERWRVVDTARRRGAAPHIRFAPLGPAIKLPW